MSWVFPGRADVFARLLWLVSILMSEDLPTFDLPINAYSGIGSFGHLLTSELLIMNSAEVIFISGI